VLLRSGCQELDLTFDADEACFVRDIVVLVKEKIKKKRRNLRDLKKEIENWN